MRKAVAAGIVALVAIAALLGWNLAAVVVREGEQVVITEFGRVVTAHTQPGLYWKTPFVQNVSYFDKRLLLYDAQGTDAITRDKKTLHIDNYARWRIINPQRFLERAQNEREAQKLLDDIIYSELRAELARHDLIDVVDKDRDTIVQIVTSSADAKARDLGIEIVDVRIKRADLPQENQQAVFQRMRAERERQATQYRSEGEEEAAKIRAETDKQRAIILAEAYRQAQVLRGEGEAEAISIYNDSLGRDTEFYGFIRSMETYQKSLGDKTQLILTPESELFRYLKDPTAR